MSAGHSEPQVIFTVNNIRAYHVQDGEESEITTSGPQTLSLLMVPTSSPFASQSTGNTSAAPEEDFYLHMHLPPELDQPLPATTQIYHKPPSSYLIPRWDLGPDSGAFTRIEFPSIGKGPGKVTQEEVDTFETILAQCTAFLERAAPPTSYEAYNPADYRPGEGYITTPVVGELPDAYTVVEASNVKPGSKTPVEIQLPTEGQGNNNILVSNVSDEYLALSRHPSYANSTIVQTSAQASRLLVTTSNYLANAMTSGAETFQRKTQPNPKPITFSPATHARVRQIHNFTAGAAQLSSKTVGQLGRYAQNLGAKVAGKGERARKRVGPDGRPVEGYKPGVFNKSMIAFSTIADGIDHAGRTLLASGSAAATNVVGHKYGQEARAVASDLTGGVKNVGLVYIDAVGVSRRAVIKSVAKGMVIGRMPNGQQLVVGSGDGGLVSEDAHGAAQHTDTKQSAGSGFYGSASTAPPAYEPGIGRSSGAQSVREKR
ncbi:hypothetical protein DV735_g2871, partial [Chaetothyriales sp. CBS 134920]